MTTKRTTHLALLPLLAIGPFCESVAAFTQFEGRLRAPLEMSRLQEVTLVEDADPFPGSPSSCRDGGGCFAGTLELGRKTYLPMGATVPVVLVATADGAPSLFADLNLDGDIAPAERRDFAATSTASATWDVVLRFPSEKAPGGEFAHLVRLTPLESGSSPWVLRVAHRVTATGLVPVDGRSVLVRLPYDLVQDRVVLRRGYLGMDCDGDGEIDTSPVSREYTFARDETVIFRVGSRYVSPAVANRESGLLLLQEHPAAEYRWIELQRGATIPDFAFRDQKGAAHRLRELSPSYTLLILWGIGCPAWQSDVQTINEALDRFAAFSVVGISDGADDNELRARLLDAGAEWTQAAAADGRQLYLGRFRVWASPTLVLIDGGGRIVSRNLAGEPPLRGLGLLNTLARLLGEPPNEELQQTGRIDGSCPRSPKRHQCATRS